MIESEVLRLKKIAARIRKDIIVSVSCAKCGHPGGSLSIADLITALYFREMNVSPEKKDDPGRDRFVLSKGHCAPALYGALAVKGFFPEEDLKTLRRVDSYLEGHPSARTVPGVDISTGSLGQGISNAVGIAIAGKLVDKAAYRVYTILGDGECEEGEVWEAAMCAAHYKLDNLCAIVDVNGLQIDGATEEVMNPNPIGDKFKAFGWSVIEISGHDFEEIDRAFAEARKTAGCPTAIIAKTVKGKGVSFMENKASWHGVAPNTEQTEQALKEIEEAAAELEAAGKEA
ncbi:MAG: transketolase [Clostridia bacterium]|nr:transketolase [Clostridia bacterium]